MVKAAPIRNGVAESGDPDRITAVGSCPVAELAKRVVSPRPDRPVLRGASRCPRPVAIATAPSKRSPVSVRTGTGVRLLVAGVPRSNEE
jgi:hypothetical protein